jgi:hypothetical protein
MLMPDCEVGIESCPKQVSQSALQEWLGQHFSIIEEEKSIAFCFRSQNAKKQCLPLLCYVKENDTWYYQTQVFDLWLKSIGRYFPGGEATLMTVIMPEIAGFQLAAEKWQSTAKRI